MNIRKRMPKTGTRKLYKHLRAELLQNNIKMGRDALFNLLRSYGLLVKKTRRFHITTNSNHFFYKSPNLLKELEIIHAEQVFVSDITYIKIDGGHAYLALVTDAYSKKIMGWKLDDNMKVSLVKQALEMAHKNRIYKHTNVIHHSDRGIQYCCPDYSDFAENKGFVLSTTQQYDPYENAVAERINGILKYEFGLKKTIKSINTAQKMIKQAVQIYNNERLHWSLDLNTPQNVHQNYNQQKYKSYAKKSA
jgi:transposase InsO family protein